MNEKKEAKIIKNKTVTTIASPKLKAMITREQLKMVNKLRIAAEKEDIDLRVDVRVQCLPIHKKS